MVNDREEAAQRSLRSRTNVPGTCQLWTRTQFGAPSAGDRDNDKDADAVDGWKSEPVSARHTDRNPPRGVPVAWSGGRNGFGHRAISLGNGKIRSTDAGGSGKVATVDLAFPELAWGLKYLGWSETITGLPIPKPAPVAKATVFGLDLSHHQFDNGFDLGVAASQGYDFFIFKVSQGVDYLDKSYPNALAVAKKLGLRVGVYHFLEAGDGRLQARHLAAHIIDKDLPVYIDVEPTDSPVNGKKHSAPTDKDWIAFRDEAQKLGLTVKGKYLTEAYWSEIGKPSLAGPLVLWRAAYPSSRSDYGSKLYPGNTHTRWNAFGGQKPILWQFTSSGKIDGYNGGVDVNAFRGSLAQLDSRKLFKNYAATEASAGPAPVKKPAPKPAKKSVTKITNEVIAGKWGQGAARNRRLKAAGYDPAEIQASVNKKLSTPKKPRRKSVNQIAREVIAGKWGNGGVRSNRLKRAGYDPQEVQRAVNKLL